MMQRLRKWWTDLDALHVELSGSRAPELSPPRLGLRLVLVSVVVIIIFFWGSIRACDHRMFQLGVIMDPSVRLPLAHQESFWWHLALWGGIPMTFAVIFRQRPHELGMALRGGWSGAGLVLVSLLLLVPLLWWTRELPGWDPRWAVLQELPRTTESILGYALLVLGYAVLSELFFRGFLLMGVRSELEARDPERADANALHLSVLLYTFAWLAAPWPQTLWAFGEGYLLGMLALRFRSFWPGALLLGLEMLVRDTFVIVS